VATKQLKAKENAVKIGARAQESAGVRDAAREPERVETTLGVTRLDKSGSDGQEPRSTKGTPKAIEADRAETSTSDAGQAGVKETKDVVETPQDVGKEEEQSELQLERVEPQQQQHQQ
jgi:hypothetical protein